MSIDETYCDICGKDKAECNSLSVEQGTCYVYNDAPRAYSFMPFTPRIPVKDRYFGEEELHL